MCYHPSSYIIFSLRKLKFYWDRGPDNPNTLHNITFVFYTNDMKNIFSSFNDFESKQIFSLSNLTIQNILNQFLIVN